MMDKRNEVIQRVCPKCNDIVTTSETVCSACGKKMMPASRIRMLGWLSLLCGVFLIGLMSWLSFWIYNAITKSGEPGQGTFRGGPEIIGFIIVVFGLVLTFGFFAAISGLWQIIYGKRNKVLTFIVIILGIAFIGIGLLTALAKR
jgi:hypothetical protein